MSTPAQEEAERYLFHREHCNSHPEDRIDYQGDSAHSPEEEEELDTFESDDDDDDDTLHSMTVTTTSTATFRVPSTLFEANTGPKGVIADAQSFSRAKKLSFRKTLRAFTGNASAVFSSSLASRKMSDWSKENGTSDDSGGELATSDDEEFMRRWRENRLKELASQGTFVQRRVSPSKRIWGSFDDVDANGYLDAVEKVPKDTVVVVCIYDPEVWTHGHFQRLDFHPLQAEGLTLTVLQSNASAEVEDRLATLAQKHITTRFVKLHQEIAEMEHVASPAILAYRAGDVFATLPDCRAKGLETKLRRLVEPRIAVVDGVCHANVIAVPVYSINVYLIVQSVWNPASFLRQP